MKKYGRSQRPYVATTEQIWALHDLMREIMCDESAQQMGPWQMQREVRKARASVKVYPIGSGSTISGTSMPHC
jgi:hypothetical protein